MYELMVRRAFVAQHFLTVPDAGRENTWHSHHFTAEILLEGRMLNAYGYLVDIVNLREALDALVQRYRDQTLNKLPEFAGLNPSLEHFARILCDAMVGQLDHERLERLTVRLWEDDVARVSFSRSFNPS
jgi:6-pyruvoyltetrahydropterin/6-carboxytetrahydropterin synthase